MDLSFTENGMKDAVKDVIAYAALKVLEEDDETEVKRFVKFVNEYKEDWNKIQDVFESATNGEIVISDKLSDYAIYSQHTCYTYNDFTLIKFIVKAIKNQILIGSSSFVEMVESTNEGFMADRYTYEDGEVYISIGKIKWGKKKKCA